MITQRHGESAAARAGWALRLRRQAGPRKIMYLLAAVIVVAAAAVIGTLAAGQASPPPAARKAALLPARNFSVARLGRAGGMVTLAAYAGRPLIINFFASWCTPCQRETPMLARFYLSMHGRVTVLGIDANDERAAALRFLRKTGVRYPVGFDPYPSRTTTSYGVYALPQTFFLNSEHRIVSHILGPLTVKDLARGVALMDKDRG